MIRGDYAQQSLYDVEVMVRAEGAGGYVGEIRLPNYSEQMTCRLPPLPPHLLDPALRRAVLPHAYGRELYDWLFIEDLRAGFERVQEMVAAPLETDEDMSIGVRFRLSLDERSPELTLAPWEAMWPPFQDGPLSLSTAFSRFLRVRGGRRWPVVEMPLRMLLIVANPRGLGRYDLGDVDSGIVQASMQWAAGAIGPMLNVDRMAEPATLGNIARFSQQDHQVMHILAHGVMRNGHSQILLESESREVVPVECEDVTRALVQAHSSTRPPLLAFLSAPVGPEDEPAAVMNSLAPMLVQAGVQAAIAVQGPMAGSQLQAFTERFYDVLVRTGVVDVAVAEARRSMFDPAHAEWTYPVLFSRAADNRLFEPVSRSTSARIASIAVE